MPANTSPDNITYPVSTDNIVALETWFANLATSTQGALNNHPYRPADNTALFSLSGMPTGSIAVVQATGVMWTYNGSAWVIAGGTRPYAYASVQATGGSVGNFASAPISSPSTNAVTWSSGSAARYTIVYKGLYHMAGSAIVSANTDARVRFRVNGNTTFNETSGVVTSGASRMSISTLYPLNAGDYVEFQILSDNMSSFFEGRFSVAAASLIQ